MKNHELKDKIATCSCNPCRALTALRDYAGSKVRISPHWPGRFCELVVVAAAGAAGLTADEVVQGRRAYARHLGLLLDGPLKDSPIPGHIKHAIRYSNHTPNITPSQQPIHLGRARAAEANGRFYLTWDPVFTSNTVTIAEHDPTNIEPCEPGIERGRVAIEIDWPAGKERIELDLGGLGLYTEVRQSVQRYKRSKAYEVYEKTSKISPESDGRFKLEIHYDPADNEHIPFERSWWGTTTIILSKGVSEGEVVWADDHEHENNGRFPFKVVPTVDDASAAHTSDADEQEIEQRDLAPTDKEILIKARRGQGIFRAKVQQLEPRCRLTGTADPAHLRASHIKSWAGSTDRERLDGCNGLMLAPHVDHLFDRALISFSDDGRLLVNDQVRGLLEAWHIDVEQRTMQPRPFSKRQCEFLKTHRERFERLNSGLDDVAA